MLPLRIAFRYLISRKSHNAVNVISYVALAGVAVAVAAMVCVMSVFNGFADIASEHLSRLDPQLEIVEADGRVFDADTVLAVLGADPDIAVAAPVLSRQALAIVGQRQMAVTVFGVDSLWHQTVDIDSVVVDGFDLTTENPDVATLSPGAAVTLGARPGFGSVIQLYMPRRVGRINPANPAASFRADTLFVTGVYQTGQQEDDRDAVIIPIANARQLLDYEGSEATSVALLLNPDADVKTVARRIADRWPSMKILDRMQQQEVAFKMIRIEKWITFMMLGLILVIASFNIISTLSMLIIEKKDSIFILGAMGATRRAVNTIFVIEGWLVSLSGILIGLVVGSLLTLAQQHWGIIKLAGDASQLSLTVYPVRLSALDVLIVGAVAALTGLLTGLLTLAIDKKRR